MHLIGNIFLGETSPLYKLGGTIDTNSISGEYMNIDSYQDSHVGSRLCMTS